MKFKIYVRGDHNAALVSHWKGSRKIPLMMFGFQEQNILLG